MKKLFKRIAPLLLALVMVLGSCLTVSAAASSSPDDYESVISKYQKDGFPYCFIYRDSSNSNISFSLVYTDQVPYHDMRNSNSCIVFLNNWRMYRVDYNLSSDSYSVGIVSPTYNSSVAALSSKGLNLLYSNIDIYDIGADKEKDDPFFRGPERPLVAAVRGASPEEALKEVILLIPLSILFLAGCLGLRKGLRLLLTLLRRA